MPIHIMLCDHGDLGLAYRETDPEDADEASIIATMMHGECDKTVAVITFDTEAGWSRDVSEEIARKLEAKPNAPAKTCRRTPEPSSSATPRHRRSSRSDHGSSRQR